MKPYYIAPEILSGDYNEKCDVWSCGVITYIMLCGQPPFNGKTENEIMKNVSKGEYNIAGNVWENVSYEAKSFVKKLLEYDPIKRVSAEQALNDSWIKFGSPNTEIDKKNSVKVFENLKKFGASSKLQKAIWAFIVAHMASRDEKSELLKTFSACDANGDGKITETELLNGFSKLFPQEDPTDQVRSIMKIADVNHNGSLDYTEFVMATMSKKSLLSKQKLEKAFKLFDKDGNGLISVYELKEALSLKEEKVKELMVEFDKNGDGEVLNLCDSDFSRRIYRNDDKILPIVNNFY